MEEAQRKEYAAATQAEALRQHEEARERSAVEAREAKAKQQRDEAEATRRNAEIEMAVRERLASREAAAQALEREVQRRLDDLDDQDGLPPRDDASLLGSRVESRVGSSNCPKSLDRTDDESPSPIPLATFDPGPRSTVH